MSSVAGGTLTEATSAEIARRATDDKYGHLHRAVSLAVMDTLITDEIRRGPEEARKEAYRECDALCAEIKSDIKKGIRDALRTASRAEPEIRHDTNAKEHPLALNLSDEELASFNHAIDRDWMRERISDIAMIYAQRAFESRGRDHKKEFDALQDTFDMLCELGGNTMLFENISVEKAQSSDLVR